MKLSLRALKWYNITLLYVVQMIPVRYEDTRPFSLRVPSLKKNSKFQECLIKKSKFNTFLVLKTLKCKLKIQ